MYQLVLGYDQSDFTYTGWMLYLFTVIEPLMACCLACMPLLQPVAEIAANNALLTWTKSLIGSSSGRTQPTTGRGGYLSASSQEGLHHTTQVTSGGWHNGFPGPDESTIGERGIYVNHQFEQISVEMVDKPMGR